MMPLDRLPGSLTREDCGVCAKSAAETSDPSGGPVIPDKRS